MKFTVINRDQSAIDTTANSFSELFDELSSALHIEALCGGCASCATCHVYVDDNTLEPADENEQAVLDGLLNTRANSRLLCQLQDSRADHITLTLAPQE